MTTCAILAPGPSMSAEVVAQASADCVIAVGNVYELAPDADILAANDHAWWIKNPQALQFKGRKVSCNRIVGVERIVGYSSWNSGVLALETAFLAGHTEIHLYGFDMHGSHFFGPYTNGLGNTKPARRVVHQQQFLAWRATHARLKVINHTEGSELKAYPYVAS